MEFISNLLAALGIGSAASGSQACFCWFMDETKCPKSLIK